MANIRGVNGAVFAYSDAQEVLRVGPFQYKSVQEAINNAGPGAVIEIAPGAYSESITIDKPMALVCKAAPGSCAIMGIHVLSDDVSLWNVGAFGASEEAEYALKVGSATVGPDRFRSFGGKFENAVAAILLQGAGDVQLYDVECAWAGSGILFAANNNGFCTQVRIERPRFHNITTAHVGNAESGGVVDLELLDGVFGNSEDGTPPAHYIKVDRAGDTGMISGCRFATATHDAEVIAIADGIMYAANITEEGVSTARPTSET